MRNRAWILLPALVVSAISLAPAQDDVAGVPSEDLKIGGDANKRYFLIGGGKDVKAPETGFKLAVIMPGGPGTADFNPFVKRIWMNALSKEYLVAQPVAFKWAEGQEIVWPTKTNPVKGMKFSTEDFVDAVIKDVAGRYKIDPRFIFTFSWSSSGPAAYAISLQEKKAVTGSFVAMSVFKPDFLPPLKNAKGHAYFIDHARDDKTCPFRMAEKARDELGKAGAKVEFSEQEGGHGWAGGDVYGRMRKGFEWLEKNAAPPQASRKK
jgi:predicted esterase